MSAMDAMRERVRTQGTTKGKKKVWHQPEVDDFAHGTVLNFDQTLTKTGWSLIVNSTEGLHVLGGGVLVPQIDPDLKSFEATFAKADALARSIYAVVCMVRAMRLDEGDCPEAIVHEMPAVMGYRTESSLMAAREVRRIAKDAGIPIVMVARQRAYANLVGASSIEKKHGTATVNRLVPNYNRVTERWTQDVHDSVLVGLQHLYEKKRDQQ